MRKNYHHILVSIHQKHTLIKSQMPGVSCYPKLLSSTQCLSQDVELSGAPGIDKFPAHSTEHP